MGIRFLCDHCQQRLNVKQKQAGTVGLCVHCRKPVQIPLKSSLPGVTGQARKTSVVVTDESTQNLGEDLRSDQSEFLDVDEQITLDGLQAGDHELDSGRRHAEPPRLQRTAANSGEPFNLGRPSPPATFGKVDPIAEAPTKVWYFRTRGFGERGPIKAKVMQRHVDEGNVGIGSMVWREDWGDWVKAEEVFPEFVQMVREQKRQSRLQTALETAGIGSTASPVVTRRRSRLMMYVALTVLGLAIVGLLSIAAVRLITTESQQLVPPNPANSFPQITSRQ